MRALICYNNLKDMKKLLKVMIAAALMLISASAYAQLSVGAGYQNTMMINKEGSISTGENFKGFYLEAGWKLNLYKDFIGFTPGARYSFGTTNVEGVKWDEQYIDVPLMFDFGYEFSDDFRFFVFAGPTVSMGITSKIKSSDVTVDMYDLSGEAFDGVADYGRFDVMLGCGIGTDLFERLRLKAAVDYGLISRIKNEFGAVSHRNQFRFGVAYLF